MTPAEIQQTLQAGMDAVKRGQKRQAREFLIRVIEADERNDVAWLWMSAAVESIDDQITALENVLDINPGNTAANKGLEQLRAKRAAERPPELIPVEPPAPIVIIAPEPEPPAPVQAFELEPEPELEPPAGTFEIDLEPTPEPDYWAVPQTPAFIAPALNSDYSPEEALRMEIAGAGFVATSETVSDSVDEVSDISQYADISPLEYESNLDDPNQCIYCGAIVAPELFVCPECGKNLSTRSGNDKLSDSLRTAIVAACISIALVAVSALYIVIANSSAGGDLVRYVITNLSLDTIFGNIALWSEPFTTVVIAVQIILAITMSFTTLALAYQVNVSFYISIGLWGINVLWVVVRWAYGYAGPVLAIGDILASIFVLFFVFASQPDFQVNLTRIKCVVDPRMKGGQQLHNLGLIYRKEGKWALAVAYWRAAIAALPTIPEFYKDLSIGYAETGYYARAFNTLEEFSRQAPDDKDIDAMRGLIEEKRAADPKPKG